LGIGGRAATSSGSPYIVLNASSKRDLQRKDSVQMKLQAVKMEQNTNKQQHILVSRKLGYARDF
jgi:hypothetical protein